MNIAIIGGDRRMKEVGRLFEKEGYGCFYYGYEREKQQSLEDTVSLCDIVVLPIPCERNGYLNAPFTEERILVEDIISKSGKKQIFGGMTEKYPIITDYSTLEGFQLHNAVLTAEGALAIAIDNTEESLFGMEITVLGFGRIGEYLSKLLKSLGAIVTVVARSKSALAKAEIYGFRAMRFENMKEALGKSHLIFNTVPAIVLGEREIGFLNPSVLFIDLASFPFGVNKDLCESKGIKLIRALGLPGKTAPVSAGQVIFKTLLSLFKERNLI